LKVLHGLIGGEIDTIDLNFEKKLQRTILSLAREGLLRSVHDVSEGGLLTALFEKLLWSRRGAVVEVPEMSEYYLFGEWQSRFLVSCSPARRNQVVERLKNNDIPYKEMGLVTGDQELVVSAPQGSITWNLEELKEIYLYSIDNLMG